MWSTANYRGCWSYGTLHIFYKSKFLKIKIYERFCLKKWLKTQMHVYMANSDSGSLKCNIIQSFYVNKSIARFLKSLVNHIIQHCWWLASITVILIDKVVKKKLFDCYIDDNNNDLPIFYWPSMKISSKVPYNCTTLKYGRLIIKPIPLMTKDPAPMQAKTIQGIMRPRRVPWMSII